jgi:hypothetical protein
MSGDVFKLTERGRELVGALRRDSNRQDCHPDSTPMWLLFPSAERLVLSGLEGKPKGTSYSNLLGRMRNEDERVEFDSTLQSLKEAGLIV